MISGHGPAPKTKEPHNTDMDRTGAFAPAAHVPVERTESRLEGQRSVAIEA